jgi:hypothetical protein
MKKGVSDSLKRSQKKTYHPRTVMGGMIRRHTHAPLPLACCAATFNPGSSSGTITPSMTLLVTLPSISNCTITGSSLEPRVRVFAWRGSALRQHITARSALGTGLVALVGPTIINNAIDSYVPDIQRLRGHVEECESKRPISPPSSADVRLRLAVNTSQQVRTAWTHSASV